MSRSFKHTPRCGDDKSRGYKRISNRKIRHKLKKEDFENNENTGGRNHSYFKRMTQTWDICDYESVGETFEQYFANQVQLNNILRNAGINQKPLKKEEMEKEYKRLFIRK